MSNVRSLNTEVLAREAVAHLKRRAGLPRRYQRQQEVVREAEGRRCRAELERTNRFLGRPSVGGRLTAGSARNEYREQTAVRTVTSVELHLECNSGQFPVAWPCRPSA